MPDIHLIQQRTKMVKMVKPSLLRRLHNVLQKQIINKIILILVGIFVWQVTSEWVYYLTVAETKGGVRVAHGSESYLLVGNCSNQFNRKQLSTEIIWQYNLPEVRAGDVDEASCGTVWLGSSLMTLPEKLTLYNAVIDIIGKTYLLKEVGWEHLEEHTLRLYLEAVEEKSEAMPTSLKMFQLLGQSAFVFTIFLKPGTEIPSYDSTEGDKVTFSDNFFIRNYFPCTASGLTLEMATLPEERSCYPDLIRHKIPRKNMDPKYFTYHGWNFYPLPYLYDKFRGLRASGPKQEWSLSCPACREIPKFLTYMHIIRNAIVVDSGVIYQIDDGLKIVPLHCNVRDEILPPVSLREMAKTPSYKISSEDAVFVIDSVVVGNEEQPDTYSILAESLLKLSLHVDFLRLNSHVSIHARGTYSADLVRRKYLQLFGLTNRVTSGLVHAKVAYLPEGIPCFKPPFLYLQSTQKLFQTNLKLYKYTQNSIVYIRRQRCRPIVEDEKVITLLGHIAELHDLKLNVYDSDENYSVNATARLFHSAVLVVSTRGDELTNILFCKPGVGVIEITTYFSAANYMQMSHKLGLRYHAFYASKPGRDQCGHVEIGAEWSTFANIVEQVLRYVLKSDITH